MRPVFLPCLDANMTHGIIRTWFKCEGEAVQPGEPLFEVETDKVNAEVEADCAGVLRQIVVPVGERIAVLSLLAFVGEAHEPLPSPDQWASLQPEASAEAETAAAPAPPSPPPLVASPAAMVRNEVVAAPTRLPASPAARRLAREKGLSLDGLLGSGGRGEITRADVEAALATPAPLRSTETTGRLESGFLADLRRDLGAFRALSSEMKLRLYREHGAAIGEHVRLDAGAVIVAPEIRIGAGASIGADSMIECDSFQVGRLAALGKRTRVRCRTVEIGDALWAKDDVMIGGGGSDEAGAHFKAGDACFFGEGAYLNPCHPLTLGDEVCIGSRAMLFTHSHWQSVLRGYPSLFGPIRVGNHVFIGNQAFVFAGVSIGAGSTVMVNSFVATNVPPGALVGGVPAQVVRHIIEPSRAEQIQIARERLLADLAQALELHGYSVTQRPFAAGLQFDLGHGNAVQFLPEWDPAAVLPQRRVVVLSFADQAPITPAPGVTVLDLSQSRLCGEQDALSDEVRECLRRRGIRFRPYAWRYRVGHCDGDRLVRRGG